jgi:hypothetical protein
MAEKNPDISFKNPNQIINMGGPWIGKLYINKRFISDNVIIDDIVYKKEYDLIFFIKYHKVSKFQIGNFFTINSWDISQNVQKESSSRFNKLYISQGSNKDELIIYNAFHDKNQEASSVCRIDELI